MVFCAKNVILFFISFLTVANPFIFFPRYVRGAFQYLGNLAFNTKKWLQGPSNDRWSTIFKLHCTYLRKDRSSLLSAILVVTACQPLFRKYWREENEDKNYLSLGFPPQSLSLDSNPLLFRFLKPNCQQGSLCSLAAQLSLGESRSGHTNRRHHRQKPATGLAREIFFPGAESVLYFFSNRSSSEKAKSKPLMLKAIAQTNPSSCFSGSRFLWWHFWK